MLVSSVPRASALDAVAESRQRQAEQHRAKDADPEADRLAGWRRRSMNVVGLAQPSRSVYRPSHTNHSNTSG
jgi:hypothetical protein